MKPFVHWLCLPLILLHASGEIRIPGFTAYTLPDPDGAKITEPAGVTEWKNPALSVNWYGSFEQRGQLTAQLEMKLPKDKESKLSMTIDGTTRTQTVRGTAESMEVDFGKFAISKTGYYRIELKSHNADAEPNGDIIELILDGPASEGAHFITQERRNAASVHLQYQLPTEEPCDAYYSEVIAVTDPSASYYMACGFHRGYFGMQVNSPTERRIIFSVWDSGGEAVDRGKVDAADRVRLLAKGEDVFTGDFGNEGTGGHSHLKYFWKTGEPQRFLLTAKPTDEHHTTFAGFYFHPEKKEWMLISAWSAPDEGGWLKGFYGFSENFWGSSGHLVRKSLHGNQWVHTVKGEWLEVTKASFTFDGTGKEDRLDRFMGVEKNAFFLSHGGYVEGATDYGTSFERPATKRPPSDLKLPQIPEPPASNP